eukprot:365011-Chlamydomonas_euryale.AAC.28
MEPGAGGPELGARLEYTLPVPVPRVPLMASSTAAQPLVVRRSGCTTPRYATWYDGPLELVLSSKRREELLKGGWLFMRSLPVLCASEGVQCASEGVQYASEGVQCASEGVQCQQRWCMQRHAKRPVVQRHASGGTTSMGGRRHASVETTSMGGRRHASVGTTCMGGRRGIAQRVPGRACSRAACMACPA